MHDNKASVFGTNVQVWLNTVHGVDWAVRYCHTWVNLPHMLGWPSTLSRLGWCPWCNLHTHAAD